MTKARWFKWSVALAAAAFLAGCGSAGREWDTTHANEVQRGVHTKAEIQGWFGPAYTVQAIADSPMGCVERWTYVYSHSVFGGSTVTDTLVVDFDAAGTVCDNAYVHQEQ
jgi:outer membrane protein assembly factor BamE (lipoprotein component of BamABCDE complex)